MFKNLFKESGGSKKVEPCFDLTNDNLEQTKDDLEQELREVQTELQELAERNQVERHEEPEGEMTQGGSKRPRVEPSIDLASVNNEELAELREKVRKLEEENRVELILKKYHRKEIQELKDRNQELEERHEENKQLKEVVEELREMIECPVCLMVPRQGGPVPHRCLFHSFIYPFLHFFIHLFIHSRQGGPVPVCSNGHFLCNVCRDRIRLDAEAAQVSAKCPSCTVDLGNATSLLASRLVERVKHECEHDGCEEMLAFAQLGKHQMDCASRKVLCPGSARTCKLEIPFNKVEEHIEACPEHLKPVQSNNAVVKLRMAERYKGGSGPLCWGSTTVLAYSKTFIVRKKRENQTQVYETVMLGSAEECRRFLVRTKILDKNSKIFTANTSRPRPISQETWGHMGLILPEKALSSIWRPDGEQFLALDVQICIGLAEEDKSVLI